jgi:hypothetical protein
MPKANNVPDAWDDDWEAQADRAAQDEEQEPAPAPDAEAPLTRKERLARHAEMQRKLWQEA